MTYVGGLRARLIHDSLYRMVEQSLGDLGWFASGRGHKPIDMTPEPQPGDKEIPLNTLVLADEDALMADDLELGSNLAEHAWIFYWDFYAESKPLGIHLIRDIRDILSGRMASIGRTQPRLDVYDWTQATPTVVFHCELEEISVDRARDFPMPWQRHWYTCRVVVVDAYGGEDDPDVDAEGGDEIYDGGGA